MQVPHNEIYYFFYIFKCQISDLSFFYYIYVRGVSINFYDSWA